MAKRKIKQLVLSPCSIICHGACEIEIAKYLRQKYRLPINIFSEDNGKKSIELTGLLKFLNKSPLNTKKNYCSICGDVIKLDGEGKILKHKIFIIIDEDGYSKEAQSFKTKEMFSCHWAKEYIVPILSTRDLDNCIKEAGFNLNTHNHKPSQYNNLLRVNSSKHPFFFEKLDKSKTNIMDLITYLDNYVKANLTKDN